MRLLGHLLVLSAVVFAASAPSSGATSGGRLIATVGLHNAYTIKLSLPNGQRVRTIPPGTYTIVVHDHSAIHNFALGSQTANKRIFTTGIPFVGIKTYRVHLIRGHYAYACSAHFQTMNGVFTVR